MERQMLRHTLDKLRRSNYLLECNREVDPVYELGGVLTYFRNRQPILFNRVKKSSMKVAGGLYGNRDIFYDLVNVNKEKQAF